MTAPASNSDLQDLYRTLILEHARNPRNFKRLDNATHTAEGINPLCGDKLHLYVQVSSDDKITDIGFEGSGCAISMASASLLTETIGQLSVREADNCFQSVTRRLTNESFDEAENTSIDLSKLKALDGVREHPSRVKCATLPWYALHAALSKSPDTATTE